MATGGDKKAACRFTKTKVPQRMGSIPKCVSIGKKIGTKITMISVHSSGQPRTKIKACDSSINCSGERFILSTQVSMICCPPKIAKTAENKAEPTNNQQTIEVVLVVKNTACFMRSNVNAPEDQASRNAPAAPIAADSVAVVIPNKMTASTTTVKIPSGMTDSTSSFRISNSSSY